MARICEICGKGVQFGHNVSHSKRRTKRVFLPNLKTKRMMVEGVEKKIKLCMKCLKRAKKFGKVGKIKIEPLNLTSKKKSTATNSQGVNSIPPPRWNR